MRPEARALGIITKSKLQQAHSRETKLPAHSFHLGGYYTQVFRDERQHLQFCLDRAEELRARAFYPFAILRRRSTGWNFPVRFESTEMIQSYHIKHLQGRTKTMDPPAMTGGSRYVPSIERVSPQLTSGAEIVRWNASDRSWPGVLVQTKQLDDSIHPHCHEQRRWEHR